jgi:ABC-2 type transport system ATP-binding protein
MLELLQVKKEYGDRVILSIPEFRLPGGVYWLDGPNGTGKTTLLKILSGMVPFKGEIFLEGTSLSKQPAEYRRQVSLAEAEPEYPPFLTGMELIRFYQDIRKADKKKTDQLIELLGFGQFLSTTIGTYSSGMIKRLSLLLAFIGPAKLILLDEPLSTLDVEATILLPQLIGRYHREYGCSFIFSSHVPFPDEQHIIHQKLQVLNQSIQPAS